MTADGTPTQGAPTHGTPIDRTDVTIVSADNPLAAWLYRPEGSSPAPVIVMSHGLSAVKEMGLDRFARLFAEAGFAVVAFDHPCFGASGGTPRQEVDPDRQLRAYRDVIAWVQGLDDVDGTRLGVWGTSFSGGHAVRLAMTDDRVRCAVAQVPYLGSPTDGIPVEMASLLVDDERRVRAGADPLVLPVVTPEPDGGGLLSPDPRSYDWFTAAAESAPLWRNEVTLRSVARIVAYRPVDPTAKPRCPLLLLPATDDVLTPPGPAHALRDRVGAPCDLVEVEGGHFDVYGRSFGVAAHAAAGWFTRWLAPRS